MSKYLRDLGIKSTASLQKHIIKETGREVICVKEASGVKIVWCYNNSLLSTYIPASVIYVIQEDEVTKVIKEIKDSIESGANIEELEKIATRFGPKAQSAFEEEPLATVYSNPYDLVDQIKKLRGKKPIKCYELHRANMPQYGCTVQCSDCKDKEKNGHAN